MLKAISLPVFKNIRDVRAQGKNICVIFETGTNEFFQVVLEPMTVAALIHTLLEKTPPNPYFETSESFASPIKMFRSAISEDGLPTLGMFFPSGIPVSVYLDESTIDSMIFALNELKELTNKDKSNGQIH